jgi:hypothetical protein
MGTHCAHAVGQARRPETYRGRQPLVRRSGALDWTLEVSGRDVAGAVWPLEQRLSTRCTVVRAWRGGASLRLSGRCRCQGSVHGQLRDSHPSARRRRQKGRAPGDWLLPRRADHEDPCRGRSPQTSPAGVSHPRQAAAVTPAEPLSEGIPAEAVAADIAYDSQALIDSITSRAAQAIIPHLPIEHSRATSTAISTKGVTSSNVSFVTSNSSTWSPRATTSSTVATGRSSPSLQGGSG